MPLYSQSRLGELYNLIQKDNPQYTVPFSANNVTVGTPTALTGQTKNTSIVVTGRKWFGYRGAKTVTYNRIDLAELTKNVAVRVSVPADTARTYYALLPYLNAQLGIYLEEQDFDDGAPVISGAHATGTITVKAGNPCYIGTLTFDILGYTYDLDTLVVQRELSVTTETGPKVTNKINPTTLVYGIDYTAIRTLLSSFSVNGTAKTFTVAESKALAQALSGVDGLAWRSQTGSASLNLYNATYSYNGIPQPAALGSPAPELSYDRVLQVNVASANCSDIAPSAGGWTLMFHYDIIKE